MTIYLPKIINVRVSRTVAIAIENRVTSEGGTISEFARWAIEGALRGPASAEAERFGPRQRAEAPHRLAVLSTDLKRLGGAHIYGLKAHRPADEAEATERLKTIQTIRDTVRDLVRS